MAIYYIDPSASTNGDGSLLSPFNTWVSAWSAAGAGSSDMLLQRYGTVWNGVVAASKNGASATAPILMGVYDSLTGARVDGVRGAATIDAQGAGIGLSLWDRFNVAVDGFEIRNCASYGVYEGHTSGTTDQKADYVTSIQLKNLYIHNILDATLSGIWIQGSGVTYRNLLIEDCAGDGITHWGQCVGEDVVIRRINNTNGDFGDCVQQQYVRPGTVWRRCRFDHSNNQKKQAMVLGSGTLIAAPGTVVEDCVFVGADSVDGAGLLSIDFVSGVTLRRNRLEGGKGVYVLGASSVVDVYSNLIVGRGADTIGIGSAVNAAVTARQNTVVGHRRGIELLGSNNAAKNNVVVSDGATPITAISKGNNFTSLDGDPLLSSAYRPLPGSPLIGAGEFLGNLQDKNSTTYQNPPSIGAYEYVRPRTAASTRTMRT